MSVGITLLTVLVVLFLAIVALPIFSSVFSGSVVLMRDALRRKRSARKVSAQIEKIVLAAKSVPENPEIETAPDDAPAEQVARDKTEAAIEAK